MICPKCGIQLPNHATKCSACHHRFTFGYGDHLPGDSPFVLNGSGKKAKQAQRILASIFIFIFLIILISWLVSSFLYK